MTLCEGMRGRSSPSPPCLVKEAEGPGALCLGSWTMGKVHTRVVRLIEIVTALQSGEGHTSKELADRFGVSRTRIFNDIRVLREVGVPIERTSGGYKLGKGFFMPPLSLSDSEVASLFFPGGLNAPDASVGDATRRARQKILSSLSDETRVRASNLLRQTSISMLSDGTKGWVLEKIRTAVLEQRRVLVIHPDHPATWGGRLEFDAYGLAYHRNTWYVIGYSVSHGSIQTFRVADIEAVEPTPLQYSIPDGFSVQDHLP